MDADALRESNPYNAIYYSFSISSCNVSNIFINMYCILLIFRKIAEQKSGAGFLTKYFLARISKNILKVQSKLITFLIV